MKIGIVGGGAVGSACLLSLVMRGVAHEIVVVDKNQARAKGVRYCRRPSRCGTGTTTTWPVPSW